MNADDQFYRRLRCSHDPTAIAYCSLNVLQQDDVALGGMAHVDGILTAVVDDGRTAGRANDAAGTLESVDINDRAVGFGGNTINFAGVFPGADIGAVVDATHRSV